MRNFIIIVILFLFSCKTESKEMVIPTGTKQLLLVITDSVSSPSGVIYTFEKQANENGFTQVFDGFNVRLGKNGLAWGRGLHPENNDMKVFKKEGDGKSPAGVFLLENVFGFKTTDEMKHLKMPYIQITEMLECIDDKTSKYYNKIIESNKADTLDWSSSEKMFKYGKWYEQGIVVAHNKSKIESGCGSCIFIHNMVEPDETTAGCTELMPENLKLIIDWLDIAKTPVLVQLSTGDYKVYKDKWAIPHLKKQ